MVIDPAALAGREAIDWTRVRAAMDTDGGCATLPEVMAHLKRAHTLVAVDQVGRKLAERTLRATTEGHTDIAAWAAQWPTVLFAIEDCRHVSRRLEGDLLRAGHPVVRVTTQLMAGQRRSGRERGKSDPIDALAVARVALREPNLPIAHLDGPSREVKLVTCHS
ncbi:hypothetical protein DP939_28020 [Spongiactinospora rosea]|uniref:Transposase IS110-like N-terminal domain-containing protein n=2 Tax=Spongiactinospora rosea TaxID=2248750 RepID=A0A366LUN6_9ACTN|nr:hypothetical protein DP939_28020 [Spongiactinospora rosea]